MKNIDISRDSFDPRKNFSRVLKQQGRVELDSDWNEQTAITLRCLRLMMQDLIGPHAGPYENCGFRVLLPADYKAEEQLDKQTLELLRELGPGDFVLSRGRYYVNGMLCEIHAPMVYTEQKLHRCAPLGFEPGHCHLVYLDVWEREVSVLEDEDIREVALGGADTAARMQVVWAVRTARVERKTLEALGPQAANWIEHLRKLQPTHRGELSVRTRPAGIRSEAESERTAEAARYRGLENQLYRVEIHHGGGTADHASFKWSRDNGSVAFAVEQWSHAQPNIQVTLAAAGRDDKAALSVRDAVEFSEVSGEAHELAGALFEVVRADMSNRMVTLRPMGSLGSSEPKAEPRTDEGGRLILRRWDQATQPRNKDAVDRFGGAIEIQEDRWLPLEDGVEVFFHSPRANAKNHYFPGDYWLIPARVATADVDWPRHEGLPQARAPHGVQHHFAPLAVIDVSAAETSLVQPLTQ